MLSVSQRIATVSHDAVESGAQASEVSKGVSAVEHSFNELRQSIIRTVRTATQDADRRMAARVDLNEPATLILADGTRHACRVRDLSRLGARIEMKQPPLTAKHATLLIDAGGPDARAGFNTMREAPDGTFGLEFTPSEVTPGFLQVMERLIGGSRQAA